jgi:MipA family protein
MKPQRLVWLLVWMAAGAMAEEDHFKGDLGGLMVHTASVVAGAPAQTAVLPYIEGEWGRFYGRVDTFGMRLVPLGQGHLEIAARVNAEGFQGRKTAYPALGDRRSPLPIGLGTLQMTPAGAFIAYLMHDPQSGGQFAELNWAAEFSMGSVSFYPQLGAQYRSAAYVSSLYGVTPAESAATGLTPYRAAGGSWQPMATLQTTVPLGGPWSLQAFVRYRRLDHAVQDSPLVRANSQTTGFLALTYTLD